MGQEYLYHFTNVENLLKIVISDSFMLNSLSNVNDLSESENIYEEVNLADNEKIRDYIYSKNGDEKILEKYNSEDGEIKKIKSFVKKSINTIADINKNKHKFDYEIWENIMEKFENEYGGYIEAGINFEEIEAVEMLNKLMDECIRDIKSNRSFVEAIILDRCNRDLKSMVGDFVKNIYIGCFNESIDDKTVKKENALWAHYGNLYSGVAIKFSKEKLLEIFNKQIEDNENSYLVIDKSKEDIILKDGKVDTTKQSKYGDEEITKRILNYLVTHEKLESYRFSSLCSTGIYDTRDEMELQRKAEEEFIQLNPDYKKVKDALRDALKERYFSKDKCWDYENEYRVLMYAYKFDKTRIFIENINEAIEGVILGRKISEADRTVITKLGKKFFGKTNFIIE